MAGGATAVNFYQLASRRAEAVLPPLVVKALAAGHRLLVRAPDAGLLGRLDAALWSFAADSFVGHGIDSEVGAERVASQKVLLTTDGDVALNGADCLVQVGGDLPDDVAGLARVLYLFDGEATEVARARWRVLAGRAGVTPVYWREGEGGRFEKAG